MAPTEIFSPIVLKRRTRDKRDRTLLPGTAAFYITPGMPLLRSWPINHLPCALGNAPPAFNYSAPISRRPVSPLLGLVFVFMRLLHSRCCAGFGFGGLAKSRTSVINVRLFAAIVRFTPRASLPGLSGAPAQRRLGAAAQGRRGGCEVAVAPYRTVGARVRQRQPARCRVHPLLRRAAPIIGSGRPGGCHWPRR
jgi:hypothetical protein